MSHNRFLVPVLLFAGALIGSLIGVALLKMLAPLMGIILGALGGMFVAACILFGVNSAKKKAHDVASQAAKAAESVVERYNPLDRYYKALTAMGDLNERLRISAGVSPAVLTATEEVINELDVLLESLFRDYPGDTLAWTMGDIATEHLPRTLGTYLAISPAQRSTQEAATLSAIAAIRQEVTTVTGMLEHYNAEEAQRQAEAIKARFGRQDFVQP